MLTALMEAKDGSGQKMILIGLTQKNISQMRKGISIRLTPEKNGIPEGYVIDLVAGEDEEAITRKLKAGGFVTEKTEIAFTGRGSEPNEPNGNIISRN